MAGTVSDRYTVAGLSRIHNRDALSRSLGLCPDQAGILTNEHLFALCYDRWKAHCPNFILGEWVFVLWDCWEKELFIATSHYWQSSLFYYRASDALFFATSLGDLLAFPKVPKALNEFFLGRLLVGWDDPMGETLYKDIHYLGPARYLKMSKNRLEIHRYWALEDTPALRYRNDRDYEAAFFDIYAEAVRCRIGDGSSVGLSLSGGLDSGSVAALAARSLHQDNQTLQAFSAVPLHDVNNFAIKGRFADESEHIRETARHVGHVDINWVRSEHRSPLQAMREVIAWKGALPLSSTNLYWILTMFEMARNKGVQTFLIGQTGNATVSWRGGFNGLIDGGGWFNYLSQHGFVNPVALARSFKRYMIVPMLPKSYHRHRQRRTDPKIHWQTYSPINKTFASSLPIQETMHERGRMVVHEKGRCFREKMLHLIKPRDASFSLFWSELGHRHGIWVTDPTADKRMLEFCVSIPNDQYYRKGVDKYLFRRAFATILPDKVLNSELRGQQAADLPQRLRQEISEIRKVVTSFNQSELCHRYMDLSKIEASLTSLDQNHPFFFRDQCGILTRGLMVGLFLTHFEGRPFNERKTCSPGAH